MKFFIASWLNLAAAQQDGAGLLQLKALTNRSVKVHSFSTTKENGGGCDAENQQFRDLCENKDDMELFMESEMAKVLFQARLKHASLKNQTAHAFSWIIEDLQDWSQGFVQDTWDSWTETKIQRENQLAGYTDTVTRLEQEKAEFDSKLADVQTTQFSSNQAWTDDTDSKIAACNARDAAIAAHHGAVKVQESETTKLAARTAELENAVRVQQLAEEENASICELAEEARNNATEAEQALEAAERALEAADTEKKDAESAYDSANQNHTAEKDELNIAKQGEEEANRNKTKQCTQERRAEEAENQAQKVFDAKVAECDKASKRAEDAVKDVLRKEEELEAATQEREHADDAKVSADNELADAVSEVGDAETDLADTKFVLKQKEATEGFECEQRDTAVQNKADGNSVLKEAKAEHTKLETAYSKQARPDFERQDRTRKQECDKKAQQIAAVQKLLAKKNASEDDVEAAQGEVNEQKDEVAEAEKKFELAKQKAAEAQTAETNAEQAFDEAEDSLEKANNETKAAKRVTNEIKNIYAFTKKETEKKKKDMNAANKNHTKSVTKLDEATQEFEDAKKSLEEAENLEHLCLEELTDAETEKAGQIIKNLTAAKAILQTTKTMYTRALDKFNKATADEALKSDILENKTCDYDAAFATEREVEERFREAKAVYEQTEAEVADALEKKGLARAEWEAAKKRVKQTQDMQKAAEQELDKKKSELETGQGRLENNQNKSEQATERYEEGVEKENEQTAKCKDNTDEATRLQKIQTEAYAAFAAAKTAEANAQGRYKDLDDVYQTQNRECLAAQLVKKKQQQEVRTAEIDLTKKQSEFNAATNKAERAERLLEEKQGAEAGKKTKLGEARTQEEQSLGELEVCDEEELAALEALRTATAIEDTEEKQCKDSIVEHQQRTADLRKAEEEEGAAEDRKETAEEERTTARNTYSTKKSERNIAQNSKNNRGKIADKAEENCQVSGDFVEKKKSAAEIAADDKESQERKLEQAKADEEEKEGEKEEAIGECDRTTTKLEETYQQAMQDVADLARAENCCNNAALRLATAQARISQGSHIKTLIDEAQRQIDFAKMEMDLLAKIITLFTDKLSDAEAALEEQLLLVDEAEKQHTLLNCAYQGSCDELWACDSPVSAATPNLVCPTEPTPHGELLHCECEPGFELRTCISEDCSEDVWCEHKKFDNVPYCVKLAEEPTGEPGDCGLTVLSKRVPAGGSGSLSLCLDEFEEDLSGSGITVQIEVCGEFHNAYEETGVHAHPHTVISVDATVCEDPAMSITVFHSANADGVRQPGEVVDQVEVNTNRYPVTQVAGLSGGRPITSNCNPVKTLYDTYPMGWSQTTLTGEFGVVSLWYEWKPYAGFGPQ